MLPLANLNLYFNNPNMIFFNLEKRLGFLKLIGYGILNFLIFLVSPVLIVNACEKTKEELVRAARKNLYDEASLLLKKYRKYKIQHSTSMKIEFGLETYYQVICQIVVLLLSKSKTPTTRGLQAIFDQRTTIFGVEVDPETILVLSIAWSLKTCILAQLNSLKREKVFFPIFSKLLVLLWSTVSSLKRILSVTVFFAPSLGLGSLLFHWLAEQIPFQARLNYHKMKKVSDLDQIYLRGLNKPLLWKQYDRWSYTTDEPTAPNYSIYTGMTLQQTLFAFFGLTILQMICILIIKLFTARNFCNCKDKTIKFIHVLECVNYNHCYQDWDNTDEGKCTLEQFIENHK